MSEEGKGSFWGQHSGNLIVAGVGAFGAILAAVIPIVASLSSNRAEKPSAPGAPPVTGKPVESDQAVVRDLAQLQGLWELVSQEDPVEEVTKTAPAKGKKGPGASKKAHAAPPSVKSWEIQGNDLIIRVVRDGSEVPGPRGSISLHRDRSANGGFFDFNGKTTGQTQRNLQWTGIYELAEETLRVCYRDRTREGRPRVFEPDVSKGGGIVLSFKKAR